MRTVPKDIARMKVTWDYLREKAEGSQGVLLSESSQQGVSRREVSEKRSLTGGYIRVAGQG